MPERTPDLETLGILERWLSGRKHRFAKVNDTRKNAENKAFFNFSTTPDGPIYP
jgi:hypothetical protein